MLLLFHLHGAHINKQIYCGHIILETRISFRMSKLKEFKPHILLENLFESKQFYPLNPDRYQRPHLPLRILQIRRLS